MDTAECYRTVRGRMAELATALTDEQAGIQVPALPAWTILETYAHLAGVSADVCDGVLTGPATDDDTAREVQARAGLSLGELCAEWATVGPKIEQLLAGPKGYRYHLLVQDAWNHEQDVLAALGMPQQRDDATTQTTAIIMGDLYARAWAKFSVTPAVRVKADSGDWVFGVGDPVAELVVSDFELVRLLIGRRTLDEIRDAGWTGDPSEAVDRLHFFPVPASSLGER
jgi:uncharacterized protein (TIGR03083 family)